MPKLFFVSHKLNLQSQSSQNVLRRINHYSQELKKTLASEQRISVCVKSIHFPAAQEVGKRFPYLDVFELTDGFGYYAKFLSFHFRNCLSLSGTKVMLIAGDPWIDALFVTLIKKFLWFVDIKTQMSVHGDVISQEKSTIKKSIKKRCLSMLLKDADSVRVVSRHLMQMVSADIGVDQSKIFVAPIPIVVPKLLQTPQSSKRMIGFVGRLHYERGLNEFIEIVKKLDCSTQDFEYLIVGDGPDKDSFLGELVRIVGTDKVDFRGYLTEDEMANAWRDCKILLSTAPAEGYGLAIRESLLTGTFVIARENLGTSEARNEIHYGLHLYRNLDDAVALVFTLMQETYPDAFVERARIQVTKSNEESLKNLIHSWL
jgi:glycosyltransferase involved in cell wall biosynthesis